MPKENELTIVMIPGMYSTDLTNEWGRYIELFSEKGIACHPLRLKYHRDSSIEKPHPQLGTVSVRDYVDDLERQIQALGLERNVMIIGHSMGGLLGQILLSRDKKNLYVGGVFLAPAPAAGVFTLYPSVVLKHFVHVILQWGFWRKTIRQPKSEIQLNREQNQTGIEYNAAVDARRGWESGRAIFEIGLNFLDFRKATYVDMCNVNVPLLFICGTKDDNVLSRIVYNTFNKYVQRQGSGRTDYLELSGYGHMLMKQSGWEIVAEYILHWIENILENVSSQKEG
ncbi:MAG: alpha/beta hydrolase [bacterium]